MKKATLFIGLAAILALFRAAAAEEAEAQAEAGPTADEVVAFQASLTPNVAIRDRGTMIEGLSINLWGENPQKGLAVGCVNGATGESKGASLGLFNYAERYTGIQWGLANSTKGDFSGWQGGPILGLIVSGFNHTGGTLRGLQSGLVNDAGCLSGVQVGLVNYAATADEGVQLGIVNVIHNNAAWFTRFPDELAPGMVFLNWRF